MSGATADRREAVTPAFDEAARHTAPAMDATIAALAVLDPERQTAAMVRRALLDYHGRAPSLRTIRRRLARLRAEPPTVTRCPPRRPRAAFAGTGATGFTRGAP